MVNRYRLLLPIGSIVKLKNIDKKIMIVGILSTSQNDSKKVNDYSGCFFPEGMMTGNKCILFDQEDIEDLIYIGYVDDEENEYKKNLSQYMETLKSAIKKYKEGN